MATRWSLISPRDSTDDHLHAFLDQPGGLRPRASPNALTAGAPRSPLRSRELAHARLSISIVVLFVCALAACQPANEDDPLARTPLPAPPDVAAPPSDAVRTASGLATKVLQVGMSNVRPGPRNTVRVHYTGWTTDGVMFDSSVVRNEPAEFGVTNVIPGWTEGLQLMVVGEKRRFWIPGPLAYDVPDARRRHAKRHARVRRGAPGGEMSGSTPGTADREVRDEPYGSFASDGHQRRGAARRIDRAAHDLLVRPFGTVDLPGSRRSPRARSIPAARDPRRRHAFSTTREFRP